MNKQAHSDISRRQFLSTAAAGTLAIAGVPLLSGFFSKDEILWKTYESGHTVLYVLAILTAFLTATYMFRLLYMCFFGESRGASRSHNSQSHGPPPVLFSVNSHLHLII